MVVGKNYEKLGLFSMEIKVRKKKVTEMVKSYNHIYDINVLPHIISMVIK